nr:hypothetical protein 35 [bacterium]
MLLTISPHPVHQKTGDKGVWIQVPGVGLRSYSSVSPLDTMEDPKNTKDDKKEEQVIQELSEEDVKGVSGGFMFHKHERNPTQVPLTEPRVD